MVDYHFKVEEGVTKEKYNEFCDGSNYFLRPPKLLCEFLRQDQTSSAQQAVDHLNIFKQTLDACKDVNPVATFQTMMLAWDTDDLIGLPPFKADFVDYVKCGTPVKDVTKSNKVIGISINIQRFKMVRDTMYTFCVCCTIY